MPGKVTLDEYKALLAAGHSVEDIAQSGYTVDPAGPPLSKPAKEGSFLSRLGNEAARFGKAYAHNVYEASQGRSPIKTYIPTPQTLPEIMMAAGPGGVFKGGRLAQLGKGLLSNIGKGAAAGAVGSAPTLDPGQVLEGTIKGAGQGVLPGLAQGITGAVLGPTKATSQAMDRIKKLIGDKVVSPNLQSILERLDPGKLESKAFPGKLTRAAGRNLDTMESKVAGAMANHKFSYVDPEGKVQMGDWQEARNAIKAMKEQAKGFTGPLKGQALALKKQALATEEELMRQMLPLKGGMSAVKDYKNALMQHTKDMDTVRFLQGLQKESKLKGGVSPSDRPGLAAAQDAVSQKSSPAGEAGMAGAMAALKHPIAAGSHLARAMQGGGVARPQAGMLTPVQKQLPTVIKDILGFGQGEALNLLSS